MVKSVKQYLVGGRKRIEKPENWVKCINRHDRNVNGRIEPAWCAAAAVEAEIPDGEYWDNWHIFIRAMMRLDMSCSACSIRVFNDKHSTTHKDILDVFDRAIAELK